MEARLARVAGRTYSQDVIVRAHIHSVRSNILTMESYPPDARYLWCSLLSMATRQRWNNLPSARIQRNCHTSSYMSRRALPYREGRVIHNANRMFLMVGHNNAISDMVKHRCGGHNMLICHQLSMKPSDDGTNWQCVLHLFLIRSIALFRLRFPSQRS